MEIFLSPQTSHRTSAWETYGQQDFKNYYYRVFIPYSSHRFIMMGNLWDIFKIFVGWHGNLWNSTVWISHIIPIDKEDRGHVSLLRDMYGEHIPIALPYNGQRQVFFPYTPRSLKFGKIWPHTSSISSSDLPIPFPHMGQIWPKLSHIIPILLLW